MKCQLCAGSQARHCLTSSNKHGHYLLNEKERFELFKCADCGAVFVSGVKTDADYYKRYYASDYYREPAVGGVLATALRCLGAFSFWMKQRFILRHLKDSDSKYKVLDIGCGQGFFLSQLEDGKFEKYGVEINDLGYQACRQRGLTVYNKKLEALNLPTATFDVITLWHVLEHLEDPVQLLTEIHRILKPQGILVIAVPNTESLGFKIGQKDWFHLDSPRHLILYNPRSLRRLFQMTNFKIQAEQHAPYDFPLDLFWSLRGLKQRFWAYPLYGLLKIFDKECLTVVCRKT